MSAMYWFESESHTDFIEKLTAEGSVGTLTLDQTFTYNFVNLCDNDLHATVSALKKARINEILVGAIPNLRTRFAKQMFQALCETLGCMLQITTACMVERRSALRKQHVSIIKS